MPRILGSAIFVLVVSLAGAAAAAERAWVALEAPYAGQVHEGPLALLEVRGRAGVGSRARHDVVLAFDRSGSTLLASGVDVDHDGEVGLARAEVERYLRRRGPRPPAIDPQELSSDAEDSIRAAQAAAARRLLDLLDLESTRVGLVAFDHRAGVIVPLGSSRELLREGLDHVERGGTTRSGGTDIRQAIRLALQLLQSPLDAASPPRRRSVLLLSDGQPTHPPPDERAAEEARRAAGEAAAAGVRIFAYALGPEAGARQEIFHDIAARSGGRMVRVAEPGEIAVLLSQIDLSGVADVTLANRTLGEPGRALRVFRDGSFDGFVRLAPGENRLRVAAHGGGGPPAVEEVSVVYARRPARDAAEQARVDALLARLKARTAEIELRQELERPHAAAHTEKQLDLDLAK